MISELISVIGKSIAIMVVMDPFLEYQHHLLLTVFVCWGIALILAASMKFLVRNAEAWKTRLLRAFSPEPSEISGFFGEQALLALETRPCCPHCQGTMHERQTRTLRNGALVWACASFPECRGTRIEMRGRAVC
jgi:hypothetical protein